jgi:hypothetical protein
MRNARCAERFCARRLSWPEEGVFDADSVPASSAFEEVGEDEPFSRRSVPGPYGANW